MGGRGTKSIQSRTRELSALRQQSRARTAGGGGGGGDADNANLTASNVRTNSGRADVGDLSKVKVVEMKYKVAGNQWKPATTTNGQMVIMDEKGQLHRSIKSSAGSTRITYEFKDFAIKVEGAIKRGAITGQNANEKRAYESLSASNKKYVPKPLSENRKTTGTFNGRRTNIEIMAFERAEAVTGPISDKDYDRIFKSFVKFKANKGGRGPMADLVFPKRGDTTGMGHNVFIVRGKNGKLTFRAVDIPYGI